MNINESLNTASAKINEIKLEAQKAIGIGIKQFLIDNPEIVALRWTQYTPYFNDGDECTFRLGEMYYTTQELLDDEDSHGDTDHGDGYHSYDTDHLSDVATENFENLSEAFSANEDLFKDTFGDHVQVTVTKDGIEIAEYEHD